MLLLPAALLIRGAAVVLVSGTLASSLGSATSATDHMSTTRTPSRHSSSDAVRGDAPRVAIYRLPLPAPSRVVRGFRPPTTRYGSGHLGVDLAARQDEPVLAAGPGRVLFAGSVAGRGVVVLAHRDGIRTEYEPVRELVTAGQDVVAGAWLGRVTGTHRGCSCLHWGARRGGAYLDPLTLLDSLGPVRLLPWSPAASSPPAQARG